jgi:hypothetical protein
MMTNVQTPSAVAANLRNMNIRTPQTQDWNSPKMYNPSFAPTRSEMTTKWQNSTAPSQVSSTRSVRQAYNSEYCQMSNHTRRDYSLGDIIAGPFHTSNTNPNVAPDDKRLTITCEGPAYSKRRMMVVLFIHIQDLYCLPLYSFSGRGLDGKPEHLKKEYVCVANDWDEGFVNQGQYRPVRVKMYHPVDPTTTIHLTGGLRVGCNEAIDTVGRLTQKTYVELVEVWSKLVGDAKKEPWR